MSSPPKCTTSSGAYWLQFLPTDIRFRALYNIYEQANKGKTLEDRQKQVHHKLLKPLFSSMSSALTAAFYWDSSFEGDTYWRSIHFAAKELSGKIDPLTHPEDFRDAFHEAIDKIAAVRELRELEKTTNTRVKAVHPNVLRFLTGKASVNAAYQDAFYAAQDKLRYELEREKFPLVDIELGFAPQELGLSTQKNDIVPYDPEEITTDFFDVD